MTKITYDMVTEWKIHEFCAFASDFGWKPGEFPAQIETDMGNGLPFLKWSETSESDRVIYRQSNGCITLTVYND
jgi:hypothetical protein